VLRQPPQHLSPERLFRLLNRAPRPRLPVSLPFPGIVRPGCPTFVYGLTSIEIEEAFDESDSEAKVIRDSIVQARLIVLSLHEGDIPVFGSLGEIMDLHTVDFNLLASAVVQPLLDVSPTFGRIDSEAWIETLAIGAEHISNVQQAVSLAQCKNGWTGAPEPDRYYGLPQQQLTDGHWLCVMAAMKLSEKHKPPPKPRFSRPMKLR